MKLLILTLLFSNIIYAQGKRDYLWILGGTSSESTTDQRFYRFVMDFNVQPKSLYHLGRYHRVYGFNASICNEEGLLLIQSSGCYINDRLFRPMPNGKINEGYLWDFLCVNEEYSIRNGNLILPRPSRPSEYYVIHMFGDKNRDPNVPGLTIFPKLLYSVIDITLNSGFGDVTQKNIPIVEKLLSSGHLTAVRHANNIDWWVITCERNTNSYTASLLTEAGHVKNIETKIGLSRRAHDDGAGQSCFSPDGSLFAHMTTSDGLFLMDFDRSTGVLSDFKQITTGAEVNGVNQLCGVAFSPNSRYVYMFQFYDLYQLDTWSEDLKTSLVHIDSWDGYTEPGGWGAAFNLARLAPDCKIYVSTGTSNEVMHIIHEPNEKGKACRFEQHGLHLPAINHGSMPNFVNYRLGYEPVCDSTLVSVHDPLLDSESKILYWPNPSSEILELQSMIPGQSIHQVQLYDLGGRMVLEQKFIHPSSSHFIRTSGLDAGMYLLVVYMTHGAKTTAKLIIE